FASLNRMTTGPKNKRQKRIMERDYALDAIAILEYSELTDETVIRQWKKLKKVSKKITKRHAPTTKAITKSRRPDKIKKTHHHKIDV
ncbi:MAG: hypothetical protein JXR91_14130, partial [Deltaproteobacteria bacterium]|nr:hypothetical protein [Deltaproteobacteria bacterium]